MAFEVMPGVPCFWSEPRYGDLQKVFLREWENMVPQKYWSLQTKNNQMTVLCESGTKIDLVSRNVDNPGKKVGIGPTYGYGFVDEAAEKFTMNRWSDLKNSVRLQRAPFLFIDSMSTPVMNDYFNLCTRAGATVIHSSSYQNPHIPKDAIDSMAADMAPEYFSQEIEGRWIRLEGRVWKNFDSDSEWPKGNMHWATWNPEKPYYIGMDLGQGIGHWQIWQRHRAADRNGRQMYPGHVDVVVAEGLQQQESIWPVIERISDQFALDRPPVVVALGHDANTLGSTGPAPAVALHQRGWPYWWPQDELTSKSSQQVALAKRILNTAGERRFCISKNIIRDGPERDLWGIKNAMETSTFPAPGSRDWFHKDKRSAGIANTEDPQDSALYLNIHLHPPAWARSTKHAA